MLNSGEKKDIKGRTSWQPLIAVIFVTAGLILIVFFSIHYSGKFHNTVSYPASKVSPLFDTILISTGIVFLVTQLLLFLLLYFNSSAATPRARFIHGSMKLEIVWTVLPLAFFVFLFIWSEDIWSDTVGKPSEDVLVVEVMGQQFSWRVRYAGADGQLGKASVRYIDEDNGSGIDQTDPNSTDDFIALQMHVPKNRPVEVLLRSRDVIHSFYIPFLGVKMDAVPGMSTAVQFRALRTTREMRKALGDPDFDYEIACAELCGRMHFAMKFILIVEEEEEFDKWYESRGSLATLF